MRCMTITASVISSSSNPNARDLEDLRAALLGRSAFAVRVRSKGKLPQFASRPLYFITRMFGP